MKLDFFQIKEKHGKDSIEVYPDFCVVRSKDLMVRGKSFYAIWDAAVGLWSTDEYDVQRLVDEELWEYRNRLAEKNHGSVRVSLMRDFSSGSWRQFRNYLSNLSDSSVQLDEVLTFANTDVKKNTYASKRLPYSLEHGDYSAWEELVSTLYNPDEREKIEWAIGSIVAGDSKHIQKMYVFYGAPGTGKSTILNIIFYKLFEGYASTFEAKALTGNSNAFATEVFRSNPLVVVEQDGDLSQIKDYTKLNSVVSHETMTFNEKFKPSYDGKVNAVAMIGTNSPVRISDSKAGIIRRLIDIHPSNRRIAPRRYQALISQIDFELGAIAQHCLEVYRERGKDYYEGYKAVEMMLQTDVFYNYIENFFDVFKSNDGITLNQAYDMYKQFCEESGIDFRVPKYKFREELRNYFEGFEERAMVDGVRVRSWYSGFKTDKFKSVVVEQKVLPLVIDETESIFDIEMADALAQYSKDDGTPATYWDNVETKLAEVDTSKEHYVKVPENHIVIDFDLRGEDGEKSAELNLEAASTWPATYAEFSKSGGGIHLHYNYAGDVTTLSRLYSEGIEVKVFTGKSSLRRRLSKCNNVPVATINSGIPLKEKKSVLNAEMIKSEAGLRRAIEKNLRKEVHPGTKSSVDFIHKILEDAYSQGLGYDVTDMRPKIFAFANNSTNQAQAAIKLVMSMKFKSENAAVAEQEDEIEPDTDKLVFFDVEVYPNLFVICWKYADSDQIVHMINPKAHEVASLFRMKLVGFNNRRYDNHILYAASMGYNNEQLYNLSKKIINNTPNAAFGAAYNLSWVDIFDYSSKKQSLKKFEIELGLPHMEMDLPWDQPVPEELWDRIVAYCDNDVMATEETHKARKADYMARLILAGLSGLSVNTTTVNHAAKIVFKGNKAPQDQFNYKDLGKDTLDSHGDIVEPAEFPGYEFNRGKSSYKGEVPGEGGYVYAEPGMYTDVALLDVASMHPSTIEILQLFGEEYTKNFSEVKNGRIAIKRRKFAEARTMLNGILEPYLRDETDTETLDALSYALKIVINIVYGMTSASFPNPFRDPRNKDNIVAKRGALFMIDLKLAVQERGFTVAHIKTDSIKIPNATPEIIAFVTEFGAKYGYEFEHEATYEKMALVNDAVYIAKDEDGWHATGAQFQHPYVFKTLFSGEQIEFRDLCEAKSVTTALYLDFTDVTSDEPVDKGELTFIGKTGLFVPIEEGKGGGLLVREKDDKFYAVSNTKGFYFMEAGMVKELGKEDDIDLTYFRQLVDEAQANISKHGDFEWFIS